MLQTEPTKASQKRTHSACIAHQTQAVGLLRITKNCKTSKACSTPPQLIKKNDLLVLGKCLPSFFLGSLGTRLYAVIIWKFPYPTALYPLPFIPWDWRFARTCTLGGFAGRSKYHLKKSKTYRLYDKRWHLRTPSAIIVNFWSHLSLIIDPIFVTFKQIIFLFSKSRKSTTPF